MAIYRHVQVGFWNDAKVNEDMIPEDKLFYLYLLTNTYTTQIGIYQITKKQMSFDIGYPIETIQYLIDRFEQKHRLIKYSLKTKEMVLLNWAKYNFNRVGKPVEDCVKKELQEVKDKSLLYFVYDKIPNQNIKSLFASFMMPNIEMNSIQESTESQDQILETHSVQLVPSSENEFVVHEDICYDVCPESVDEPSHEAYNEPSYDTYNDTSTSRTTIRGEKEEKEEEKEKEEQKEKKIKDQPNGRSNVLKKEFDIFWSCYPRKSGKSVLWIGRPALCKRKVKQGVSKQGLETDANRDTENCHGKKVNLGALGIRAPSKVII